MHRLSFQRKTTDGYDETSDENNETSVGDDQLKISSKEMLKNSPWKKLTEFILEFSKGGNTNNGRRSFSKRCPKLLRCFP